MTDWKNDLRTLADKLRADQKNKKGFQSKFAKVLKSFFQSVIKMVSPHLLLLLVQF